MNIRSARLLCFAVLFAAHIRVAGQDSFTNESEIKAFLHDNFDGKSFGMVVGLVDEHGGKVFNAGKLDNNTDREVNGDTVFEIGSITKSFTTLLLQDMVERG